MGACPVVEMSGCFSQVITSLVKCFFTVMTENFGKILRWRKSGSVENPGFFVPSRYVGTVDFGNLCRRIDHDDAAATALVAP